MFLGRIVQDKDATKITHDHFATVVTNQFSWPGHKDAGTSYQGAHYADTGAGEFQDGTRMDTALDLLGTTGVRYPGGTEAWKSFNWRPENQVADSFGLTDYDKLRQVIEYCAANNLSLSFTFPVRGIEDPVAERAAIQTFLREELLEPAAALGVKIDHIKIGNEYHIAPQITAEHYGDIASSLTLMLGRELDRFEDRADTGWSRPDLMIEPGHLWQYGMADIAVDTDGDGVAERNGIQDTYDVFSAFNATEASYVDAIDIHSLTLKVEYADLFGAGFKGAQHNWLSLDALYDEMLGRWDSYTRNADGWGDLDYHTLAWSLPNENDSDGSALSNAGLVIQQYQLFSEHGIKSATSWMAATFANNALSVPASGGQDPSATYLTAGGEMVALLRDNVIGLKAVDFAGSPGGKKIAVDGFADDDTLVVYLTNTTDDALARNINLTRTLKDMGLDIADQSIEITRLGTKGDPTDYRSRPEVSEDLLVGTNSTLSGNLKIKLGAFEIVQIRISDEGSDSKRSTDEAGGAAASKSGVLAAADSFEFAAASSDSIEPVDLTMAATPTQARIAPPAMEAEQEPLTFDSVLADTFDLI